MNLGKLRLKKVSKCPLKSVAQTVKSLLAVWENWVQFQGRDDPLEKEMAAYSSILPWRIPWTEEPGGLDTTEWLQFSSVQSLSHVWLFATPWAAPCQASLSISNSQSLPKPISIVLVIPSNHLILCRPLLLLSSIFPSIRVFSNESALCIRWPKYWSFSFNSSPSNEHQGLISFRMDWLDLLAVQGALKSFLQHHNSKASILWRSAFFIVQLAHPYMTTTWLHSLD